LKVIEDVVCPFCGCLCDDIKVTFENDAITRLANSCAISIAKFKHYKEDRVSSPSIRKNKRLSHVSLDEAVKETAAILVNARYPLLYGWSSTSCEALKVGIKLAEELGGVIDNTTTTCHGPSILGIQDVGESTCTLGEVKHRADLIIYWGSNPVHAHPRHLTRYTLTPEGKFRASRKDRTLVVVDVRRTSTARQADHFVQVEPNRDYELLSALRMAVRFEEIEQEFVAGIPKEKIEELADLLINCQFGVLFFGLGLTMSSGKERNIEAALSLVRDLNRKTKFNIMPMRGHFNVTGANKVTTWQTGFPYAVDFTRGYPRYSPGVTTALDILNREECDAALIVASDPIAHAPKLVVQNLLKIPIITIDPKVSLTSLIAEVAIPTTLVGIEAEGVAYRMDGIPKILKKIANPPAGIVSDAVVLEMILREVQKQKGAS
jgi:formylmethanofuran dehydrogenase subunit B